ncbi:phosphatase PAP2 family protein [Chitinophagaceae bacterium LB-8]|uniref:Phosphatase PAP2 family protein n=1 Tax=Paraflavisolibacter caeni TaxID=2982496 RepID=A0A9X3BHS9_9BACT|nr:phosphatase PAP2 family protein [Paraflavisolibacter caeni]MCU7549113.1 phosphatase PAP2 family protein [Paraflavisolibacter caeni]
MKEIYKKYLQEISLKTAIAILLFFISLFAFAMIADEVVLENEDWFDTLVFSYLKNYATPAVINFFRILTLLGSPVFLLPSYFIIVMVLLINRRWTDAIDTTVISLTSTGLMYSLKTFFGRKRPDLPLFETLHNYSFPSGHALSSFIFCSVLIWLTWKGNWSKKWKLLLSGLLLLLSILIGISRIVLRYHYASDVLAGFLLGFAWVLLSFWLLKTIHNKMQTTKT